MEAQTPTVTARFTGTSRRLAKAAIVTDRQNRYDTGLLRNPILATVADL
ncbi:MAG: hypothetical protein ACC645_03575 [Pirellulales bacterium]